MYYKTFVTELVFEPINEPAVLGHCQARLMEALEKNFADTKDAIYSYSRFEPGEYFVIQLFCCERSYSEEQAREMQKKVITDLGSICKISKQINSTQDSSITIE